MMEFHISRSARDRYQVRDILFSFTGNAIFASPAGSRELAHRMNEANGTADDPARATNPGALYAMGLIDEASHAIIAYYREHVDPAIHREALAWFSERVGEGAVERLLAAFIERFPPADVYQGKQTATEWLAGSTDGFAHREAAFEELLLLWMANNNPAFEPFRELFDDKPLAAATVYREVTASLPDYYATKPALGPGMPSLLDALREPVLIAPGSLAQQLETIRMRWGVFLGDQLRAVIRAQDILREEEVAIWMRFNPPTPETLARRSRAGGMQDQHSEVPTFSTSPVEYEKFSPDQDWMPNTVLIAKSTYVWLAQLSRWYGRSIERLDQIPDEELDRLGQRGMNALWLIGVWERSRASKTIKRLCGNQDAVASAYSLYDYRIADDLGGEPAYRDLRDRAARRGIRLASDMVPNHMGIDSIWVIEHPEWFLSRPDSPYPAYRFAGPDLSSDARVEIKIDDHYYEQTDAAVVFERRDKWTGDTRYIYHGNDGTSFPWNDTAQLNYLSAAVREQVIQTILHVARLFPIIRFDAAMTLAKRHVQRLWFPSPGSGGAIPSRAECSMTTAEFDAAIPNEFWREVVDRVAAEVPGTLLLAEAFWLMEGYFVRTLGMHRVYNSAFMNMLRDEDNAKYRQVLKNTMEFDPGILKRYVNFMSNPDEKTAIEQFGSGDKYFGVATMMATLPGLPMFGHGQVEGFTEKYGMEYYRPRYNEDPNGALVARHNREIAPLLHNRRLFAESDEFLLYDFWREDGSVDENVYAYSNRRGDDRALIVYHNRFAATQGTLHHSAAYQDKQSGALRQRSLAEGLALANSPEVFVAYRNTATGLEYLRRCADIVTRGLSFQLHAYQYAVLLYWRELRADADHPWDKLHDALQGAGVPNLDEALLDLELSPVHAAFASALSPELVQRLATAETAPIVARNQPEDSSLRQEREDTPALQEFEHHAAEFFREAMAVLNRQEAKPAAPPEQDTEMEEELHPQEAPSGAVPANVDSQLVTEASLAASSDIVEARREEERSAAIGSTDEAEATHSTASLADALRALQRLSVMHRTLSPAARSVLPSDAPAGAATAIWAPALAMLLARELQQRAGKNDTSAFDQLRLRHATARDMAPFGLAGEDGWRAAARVRLSLLPQDASEPKLFGISESLWAEPDVHWLLGVHEAGGTTWFVKEPHEQLLWWLGLPQILSEQLTLDQLQAQVEAGCAEASETGYRLPVIGAKADIKDGMQDAADAAGAEQDAPGMPELDEAIASADSK